MQKFAVLLSSSLVATALAQSPLVSNTGPNLSGNAGGGVYFDLTTGAQQITITDLAWTARQLMASVGGMDIYMGPSTWEGNVTTPAAWTLVTSTATTALTPGVMTAPAPLAAPICLAPNTTYGIALTASGDAFGHNYSSGTGLGCPTAFQQSTNLGGNQQISTAELTFRAGAAQNLFLSGGVFCPRVWSGEIHYTVGPCPAIAVASKEPYGEGCYAFFGSYGELFANPATMLDIAGLTTTHAFHGATYDVTATSSNSYVAPSAGATVLPLVSNTDRTSLATALGGALPFPILYPRRGGTVGTADDLEVHSTGFITPVDVAGNGTTAPAPGSQPSDTTPTLLEFFATGKERWCPLWQNMIPNANITAEVDSHGDLVVSWNAVIVFQGSNAPNTFQVAFSPNGDVEFRVDASTIGSGGGSHCAIVGWTQGNGALEHAIDVSTIPGNPFTTDRIDNAPLNLDLNARPVLGSNPYYVIRGYDASTTPLGVVALDLVRVFPGISLSGLGMPDCLRYTNPVAVRTFVTGGAAQVTMPFLVGGIPANPAYNGLRLYGQALTMTGSCAGNPCNSLGVIASQGLRIALGTL